MCSDRYKEIAAFEEQVSKALWKARSGDEVGAKLYRTKYGPDRGEPHILEKNSSLPRPEWIVKGTSCHYEISIIVCETTAQWAFENGFTLEEIARWWSMQIRPPATVRDGWPWSAKARWAEGRVRANRNAQYEAQWRERNGIEPIGKTMARKEAIKKKNAQRHRQRRQAMVDAIIGT